MKEYDIIVVGGGHAGLEAAFASAHMGTQTLLITLNIKMMGNMPQITFFSNLIYCFFFGTILSFILSRNVPSRNPFADHTSDEW